MSEHVPETRNRVIQRIRTPIGVFFFSVGVETASSDIRLQFFDGCPRRSNNSPEYSYVRNLAGHEIGPDRPK